jgi:hypothetical protein
MACGYFVCELTSALTLELSTNGSPGTPTIRYLTYLTLQ